MSCLPLALQWRLNGGVCTVCEVDGRMCAGSKWRQTQLDLAMWQTCPDRPACLRAATIHSCRRLP